MIFYQIEKKVKVIMIILMKIFSIINTLKKDYNINYRKDIKVLEAMELNMIDNLYQKV